MSHIFFPQEWKIAKEQLRSFKILESFLKCRDPEQFKAWKNCMVWNLLDKGKIRPRDQEKWLAYLQQCWDLYYVKFGPWGQVFGRTGSISQPDSAS
jgi:hypothetical protein